MSEHIAILMVRWMSGLVTGLQNRLQRFESASDLRDALQFVVHLFFCFCCTSDNWLLNLFRRSRMWLSDGVLLK